ncbi:MAG: MBL fold metallo-hydrolase [Formosimonas sp.]
MKHQYLKTLAAAVMLAGTFSVHAETSPQKSPRMVHIKNNVYQFQMDQYSSLVVIDDKGVIVVDPNGEERAKILQQELRKLTKQPVKYVIYSHAHFDHSRGGAIFKKEGAKFITNQRCTELLDRDLENKVVKADVTYDQKYQLKFGKQQVDLHYFGANDGQCMSIVHLPKDKTIFAVDWHLQGYVNEPYRLNQHDYIGTLNTLRRVHKELKFDTVVSSHMPQSSPEQLAEDLAFNEALYAAVWTGLQQGKSVDELVQTVKLPQFSHWMGYEKNFPAHVARMAYAIWHGH